MVRTLQSELLKQEEFRRENCSQVSEEYFPNIHPKCCNNIHMRFPIEICVGRDGKVQEAGYTYEQTCAYVRSRI